MWYMTGEELAHIMQDLGLKPVSMSRSLGISYSTFKQWKGNQRKIPPIAIRAIELLIAVKDTEIGERFGV